MSKVLIHSLVFSPDGVSTAYLYNDIAKQFKAVGYDVSVLTTTPHYNILESELEKQVLEAKFLGLYYVSRFHGIKVKHIPQKKFKKSLLRLFGFVYWHIMSFILALLEKDVDIILSPSPPLTIGFLNIIIGKLKGAKVVYNVQEIYPDLLIEEGELRSKSVISFLKWLEKFIYNKSDAVTTIDRVFYNTIVDRFYDSDKLLIIPNFVDTAIYKPISGECLTLCEDFFPTTDTLKVMYAGNVGYAQDWEPLIRADVVLKNRKIDFFIIGEGVMKAYLQTKKEELGLTNLHLLPYQPRELMPSLIAYSDLQFIFMSPSTEGHGFPSKVYTIMACGKPMLICSGEKTPIVEFLKDKKCSYLITDREIEQKTNSIVQCLCSTLEEDLIEMGTNGMLSIGQKYTKEIVTKQYIALVESLIK